MGSERLGPARLSLATGLRAAAIGALAFAALLAAERHLYATVLVIVGLLLVLVLDMIRSATTVDRVLAQFVESLTAEGHDRPAVPKGLARLGFAVEQALGRLSAARAERQGRIDFVEALIDTVPAALLVVDQAGAVVTLNRAAALNLGAVAGPLRHTRDLAPVAERLLRLPPGAREVVRLADGRAMLAQTGVFSAPGRGRLRLLALQGVARELDAVELKAWQDLTRVLAHEMMNSLTPITSLSESAAARLAEGALPPEEARAALEVIARRSAGLLSFVERYRRLTDLPAAALAPVALADLAARLDRLLAPSFSEAGIDYASAVSPPTLKAMVDADLLEQALINLLKNAADAVRGRPGAQVRLSCGVEEDGIVFVVRDNGPGVPTADPEAVFVPFFTTKAEGSGIGLTLCRQIAIAHGGQLEYRRRETGGAEFRMRLPPG